MYFGHLIGWHELSAGSARTERRTSASKSLNLQFIDGLKQFRFDLYDLKPDFFENAISIYEIQNNLYKNEFTIDANL